MSWSWQTYCYGKARRESYNPSEGHFPKKVLVTEYKVNVTSSILREPQCAFEKRSIFKHFKA